MRWLCRDVGDRGCPVLPLGRRAATPTTCPLVSNKTASEEDLSVLKVPGHLSPSPQTQLGKQDSFGFLGQSFYFLYTLYFSDFLTQASLPGSTARKAVEDTPHLEGAEDPWHPRLGHGPEKSPRLGMAPTHRLGLPPTGPCPRQSRTAI